MHWWIKSCIYVSLAIITNIVTELLVNFTSEERRSQMRKKCKPYCLPENGGYTILP
jgi:hypothetical protein